MAELEGLYVSLQADTGGLETGFTKAGQVVATQTAAMEARMRRFDTACERMARTAVSAMQAVTQQAAGLALVLGGGAWSVDRVVKYADAWTNTGNRLKLVTKDANDLKAVQAQLFAAAQKAGTAFDPVVEVYSRAARAGRDLGASQDQLIKFSGGVAQALAVGGTAAEAQAGALQQLGQLLGSSRVQAEEFNSVLDGAPRIAQAVADGLGTMGGSVGRLKQAINDGRVSNRDFFEAFLSQLPKIQAEFDRTAPTVARALQVLDNAAGRLIGVQNEAAGATTALAQGIMALAGSLDVLARYAVAGGAAIGAVLIARGLGPLVPQVAAATIQFIQFAGRLAIAEGRVLAGADAVKAYAGIMPGAARATAMLAAESLEAAKAAQIKARADLAARAAQYEQALAVDGAIGRTERLTVAERALAAARLARTAADERVVAAETAHAAALSRTTIAARAAQAGGAALALVGGPVGAALMVAGGAALYFATRASAAEEATRLHEEALRGFNDVVDRSTGKVKEMTAAVAALRRQQLEAARDAAQAVIQQQETYARAGAFKIDRAVFESGLPKAEADRRFAPARELQQQFLAGRLAAEQLYAELDKLAQKDEALKPLVKDAAAWAAPLTEAQGALAKVEAALAVLAGTADDGQKALLGIGREAAAAATPLDRLGTSIAAAGDRLAELERKVLAFKLPEGFQRRLAEMSAPPPVPQVPVVTGAQDRRSSADDVAYQRQQAQQLVDEIRLRRITQAEAEEQIRLIGEEAKAAEKLAGARASGNVVAIKEAEVEAEVVRQRRAGFPADQEGALKKALLRKATAELSGEIGAGVTQLGLETDAQRRLAAAAGQGEAAMRRARIENEVAAAALKGLAGATRAALEEQEGLQVAQIRGEQTKTLTDAIRLQTALTQAYAEGPAAVAAVQQAEQARALALREAVEGTDAYSKAYARYLDLIRQGAGAERSAQVADFRQQQEESLALARADLELIGRSADERELILGRLRDETELRRRFPDIAKQDLDALVQRNEALRVAQQAVQRQQAAWKAVGDAIDAGVVRPLESAIDAIVKGEGAAIRWGNVFRAMLTSVAADLARLALINPLKNWVGLGDRSPSLWDLGGSSAAGGGQQPGGGGLGTLSNLSSAASLANQAGLFGNTFQGIGSSITNGINSFGSSVLGIGSTTAAGGTVATVGGPTFLIGGQAGPYAAATSAGSAGSAAAGAAGLTSYLGPIGGGFAAGSLLGGWAGTASNSKAVGGLAGAASGAAAGAAIGSIIPGIGTLVGALIGGAGGGLGGLLGTQKATVGPNGGANIGVRDGQFVVANAAGDNGFDVGPLRDAVQRTADSLNALARRFNIALADPGVEVDLSSGAGPGGKDDQRTPDEAAFLRRVFGAGYLRAGGLMGEVIDSEGFRGSTSLDQAAQYLDLADRIQKGLTAFESLDRTLADVTETARKAQVDGFQPVLEELKKAGEVGVDDDYRGLLEKQIRAMLATDQPEWSQLEVAMAQAQGSAAGLKEAIGRMGVAISAAEVDAKLAADVGRLQTQWRTNLDRAIAEATGESWRNGIRDALDAAATQRREAGTLGIADTAGIDRVLAAQLGKILEQADLTAEGLERVRGAFGDQPAVIAAVTAALGTLATGAAKAAEEAAAQARAKAEADLRGREDLEARRLAALGRITPALARQAELYEREVRYRRELADAQDDASRATLEHIQLLERHAEALAREAQARSDALTLTARANAAVGRDYRANLFNFDARMFQEIQAAIAAGQDPSALIEVLQVERARTQVEGVAAAIDREIATRERVIAAEEQEFEARRRLTVALTQQADALLTDAALTNLDPASRLAEAERQFTEALEAARGGDQDAAERLDALGRTAIEAEKAVYAGTRDATFALVRAGLKEIAAGGDPDRGRHVDESTLGVQRTQLEELKRLRELAQAQLEGLNRPSVEGLSAKLAEATAALSAAVAGLSPGTRSVDPTGGTLLDVITRPEPVDQGPSGDVTLFGVTADQRRWRDVVRAYGYTGPFEGGAAIRFLEQNHGIRAGVLQALTLHQQLATLPKFAGGGYLPAGRLGIAGETGRPELIMGPAHVVRPDVTAMLLAGATAANDRWAPEVLGAGRPSGGDWRPVVAAVRDLAVSVDGLRAELRAGEGAAQEQRSLIAADLAARVDRLGDAIADELPRRVAGAMGR